MWATDMYTTHGQDSKVEHYLKPHFMDGYIKRDDYLYINTGYLKFDTTLLTRQTKLAPTKKITCYTLTPKHSISGATQNFAPISSSAGSSNNS